MLLISLLKETVYVRGIFLVCVTHGFLRVCDRENETAEACLEFSLEDDERKGKSPLLQYQDYRQFFQQRDSYFVLSLDRCCWNNAKEKYLSHIKELKCFSLGQFHLKWHWREEISKISYKTFLSCESCIFQWNFCWSCFSPEHFQQALLPMYRILGEYV